METVALSKIEEKSSALVAKANAIQVKDQDTHDEAAELYVRLGDLTKEIDSIHDPAIAAAHASHKAAIEAKNKLADPVRCARAIIKPKVTAWEQDQLRIQQERQRLAEEAARKIEEEARLALAVEAEQKGAEPETVKEILETPVVTVTPVVAPAFQKTNGFKSRESWSAEVYDIRPLCKGIAEGRYPTSYVMGNMPVLNGMARSLKSQLKIDGVKANKSIV